MNQPAQLVPAETIGPKPVFKIRSMERVPGVHFKRRIGRNEVSENGNEQEDYHNDRAGDAQFVPDKTPKG